MTGPATTHRGGPPASSGRRPTSSSTIPTPHVARRGQVCTDPSLWTDPHRDLLPRTTGYILRKSWRLAAGFLRWHVISGPSRDGSLPWARRDRGPCWSALA